MIFTGQKWLSFFDAGQNGLIPHFYWSEVSFSLFFSREKKSARENYFLAVFWFFHGQKWFFTYTFFRFFHAQFSFSRTLFLIFFTGRKFSFTGKKMIFARFSNFLQKMYFSLIKIVKYSFLPPRKIESNNLYVKINEVFSRILCDLSRAHFLKFFTGTIISFTGGISWKISRALFYFHGHLRS